jgi:hypothetical protein
MEREKISIPICGAIGIIVGLLISFSMPWQQIFYLSYWLEYQIASCFIIKTPQGCTNLVCVNGLLLNDMNHCRVLTKYSYNVDI